MMPGNYEVSFCAQFGAAKRDCFRSLNLDVDSARSALYRQRQDAQLLVDAAVKPAVILVAAACRKNCAIRILPKE